MKRRIEQKDESQSDSDSDEIRYNDTGNGAGSDIEVDFEFADFNEQDFHGVSLFLKNLLDIDYNVVSLAETITDQQNIGTGVKTGDEGCICAFGTVLNPNQYYNVEGVRQLRSFVMKHAQKHATEGAAKLFQKLLAVQTPEIVPGIVLSERIVNSPPEIAPKLHRVLLDDIAWSCLAESECPPEEQKHYLFTHLIFLSYFFAEETPSDGSKKKKKKKSKKNSVSSLKFVDQIYPHVEDETFLESSEASFSWKCSNTSEVPDSDNKLTKYRLVYVMKREDYENAVDRMMSAFS